MATPAFNEAFIIGEVDVHGQPTKIWPYYTNLATYMSMPINLALKLSEKPIFKAALSILANEILPQSVDSWRKKLSDEEVATIFIGKIQNRYPVSFVERSLDNPDLLAAHWRRICHGNGYNFEPHAHCIVLNGRKVKGMCEMGVKWQSLANGDSAEGKQFRTYLFTFFKTNVHELAHVFVTFLGHGRIETPPNVAPKVDKKSTEEKGKEKATQDTTTKGEAGRWLEERLFGGLVLAFRPTGESVDQAGTLYLQTEQGYRQITQETIDRVCNYQFDLPLKDKDLGPHLGPDMCSLGFGLPRRGVTKNPMSDPFAQHLLAVYKQQRNYGAPLWDGIGELLAEHPARELTDYMESVLKKVAYNPTLRLQSKLGLKPSEIVKDEGAESSEESDDEGAESSEEEDDEGAEHSEESDNGGAEPTSEDDSEK